MSLICFISIVLPIISFVCIDFATVFLIHILCKIHCKRLIWGKSNHFHEDKKTTIETQSLSLYTVKLFGLRLIWFDSFDEPSARRFPCYDFSLFELKFVAPMEILQRLNKSRSCCDLYRYKKLRTPKYLFSKSTKLRTLRLLPIERS